MNDRHLPTVAPSRSGPLQPLRLASLLSSERAGALTQGSLIHEFFEQVQWSEAAPPSEAELRNVAKLWEAERSLTERCLERFHSMLRRPEIAWCLSMKSYLPPRDIGFSDALCNEFAGSPIELELLREQHLRVRDGQRIISGTIDRLVLLRQRGRLVGADIIDFKTDAVDGPFDEETEAKWEQYRDQLRLYARAVALRYNLASERITTRLVLLGPGRVELVDAGVR